jgi:hypothetical protein
VGTKSIVPRATPLRSFVYMMDCMNNIRSESYEGFSFLVVMLQRICERFHKRDEVYLVL